MNKSSKNRRCVQKLGKETCVSYPSVRMFQEMIRDSDEKESLHKPTKSIEKDGVYSVDRQTDTMFKSNAASNENN